MTNANPAQHILYHVENGIARVTINRPEARNAFTFDMYEELAKTFDKVNASEEIRALILTGAGDKAFSAGTDISMFGNFKGPGDALEYEAFMDRVLMSLENCRVPTIAAIAGACTGGGGAIAACCDIRIGTKDTKFGFPIARTLGNCLSIKNLARLSALVGPARVKEMIFTAKLIEAQEALSIGLLNAVVEGRTELDEKANAMALQIAGLAPLTLRATKEGIKRLQPDQIEDRDLILMCYGSRDFQEGMSAFLEKRSPSWKGV